MTLQTPLHTPHCRLHTAHWHYIHPHFTFKTLHTPHATLRAHFTIQILYFLLSTKHTQHIWRSQIHTPHITANAIVHSLRSPHCTPHTLACKLYTPHCKLHTSHHHALNAPRCISHSTYRGLQLNTIHCKHYIPRHARSTHQSLPSALQTANSTLHISTSALHPPLSAFHTLHSTQLPAIDTTTLHTFVIPADTTAPSTLHILRYVTAHTDSTGPILTTLQSLLPHALHNTSLFRLQPRHSTFYTLQSPHTHCGTHREMVQDGARFPKSRPRLTESYPRSKKRFTLINP